MMTQTTMEKETGIAPDLAADFVLNEFSNFLQEALPLEISDYLESKAIAVYDHHAGFNRSMRQKDARRTIKTFMRHWLAGYMKEKMTSHFARLPESCKIGYAPE